jgi:hypothetical protein
MDSIYETLNALKDIKEATDFNKAKPHLRDLIKDVQAAMQATDEEEMLSGLDTILVRLSFALRDMNMKKRNGYAKKN